MSAFTGLFFRGQLWYVMQDRTSGRFHRFAPETYFVISLMNGERSMQEVWDIACDNLSEKGDGPG
ncbi:hypothetical protein QW131_17520 [Roseibium salinum]|nr:hypothetical protein [Roseibium salinum]